MGTALSQETRMKIHVNRVPPEGLEDHATYDPAAMDMDRLDLHLVQPFGVDAFITRVERELVVKVQIHCPVRAACARCLEEFDAVLSPSALFSYQVTPTDVVDITEDVRQEVILAYPMIPVCRSDCRGLCSACGQNLNQGGCAHYAERR